VADCPKSQSLKERTRRRIRRKRAGQGAPGFGGLTNQPVGKFNQRKVECELAGANKLKAQKTIGFHDDVIMLAGHMPETGSGLGHLSLGHLS
jgi:hypothetical protein